jgi:hypothetical protein
MKTRTIVIAGVAVLAAPGLAIADDEAPSPYSYSWHESQLKSDIGISTQLGGGVSGFTDQTMRDTVSSAVSGLWDLRVTLGSHTPLAVDVGYVGTAANIDALVGTQSGTLIGNTFEGALRYNVLPHYKFTPYAFAGVGWQRYDVTGGSFTTSDSGMADSDNSMVFPLGAGLSYRDQSGLVVDLRGTFRANTNAGLVLDNVGSTTFAPLHTWAASGSIGYEF